MKKLLIFFLLIAGFEVNAQTFTQTYVDKCTGEIKVAISTPVANGMSIIAFYNQTKIFTNAQINSGEAQIWLNQVYADYNSRPCPVSTVVTQTVQQTVQQAASAAASTAASSAASSSASSAASSSASSAASSSASSTGSSSSASSSGSSSSSSSSSESKNSGSNSESKSETKSESKSEESKSESKSEEKKSDEKKEEKKEEEKKEEKEKKKKQSVSNPTLVSSDLAITQGQDGGYSAMFSTGISKSSMTGASSWGLTSMIWTTLDQFALNSGYTKMNFQKGVLKNINSYSITAAYLQGNIMIMQGYTFIKPDPKIGTYGYNIGVVNLLLKNENRYDYSASMSAVGFWTKIYKLNRKSSIGPQIFITSSPISWNPTTNQTLVSRHFGFMSGFSYDYKLTGRFGLNLNYRFSGGTQKGAQILHNFMIGSRIML